MEEHDAERSFGSGVGGAHAREVSCAVSPDEVDTDDLHLAGRRLDLARVVDEERDAVVAHRARDDLRGLVVVVAVAREDAPRQLAQGRERVAQEVGVPLGLHREKIARQQHDVRLGAHGARADVTEPRDRHERSEVRGR